MNAGGEADRVLLDHIRECIERIQEYTDQERSVFFESHLVQDTVMRNLQTLAESTQRLSEANPQEVAKATAATALKDPDRLRGDLETALNRFLG